MQASGKNIIIFNRHYKSREPEAFMLFFCFYNETAFGDLSIVQACLRR